MEKEIEKKFEEIEKILEKLEKNKIEIKESADNKKKSIKEFILEKKPKGNVQETICISYYIENFEGKDVLTSKDIQKCFKDAKLKTPSNVPNKVQKAIARGWIAKGDKRGEFYLTTTGERVVENNFEAIKDE